MKKLLKPLDYIFVLQPVLFFPVWAVFLAGFYVQNKLFGAEHATNGTAANLQHQYVWVGLALTGLMGAIFILYQVMERDTNGGNPVRLIASGMLTPKAAFIEAVVLLVVVMIAGFILAPEIAALFFILVLVAGVLYNFSPFKLKDRPVQALLVNGLVALLIFSSGWVVNGVLSGDVLIHAIPYICAAMALFVYTSLRPGENDGGRFRTFAEKYGMAVTAYAGLLLNVASFTSGFLLADELIFYPAFFSMPVFVWALVKLKPEEFTRAAGYMIFLMAISVSFKWHVVNGNNTLFLVLLGLYIVSRAYYRLRFGIRYPSLSVEAGS